MPVRAEADRLEKELGEVRERRSRAEIQEAESRIKLE